MRDTVGLLILHESTYIERLYDKISIMKIDIIYFLALKQKNITINIFFDLWGQNLRDIVGLLILNESTYIELLHTKISIMKIYITYFLTLKQKQYITIIFFSTFGPKYERYRRAPDLKLIYLYLASL